MKPLPIVAVAGIAHLATDPPRDHRPDLKAVVPDAPRRLNRLIELALTGAHRCMAGRKPPDDTPIYVALTAGCIGDSAALVNNVVRGRPVMPVSFINVSSNMAGFYVASSLGLHSANHVVSCNDFAWESALEMAMLGSASMRGLLVGAVEECAWPLDDHRERLHLPIGTPVLETSHWLYADRAERAPRATVQRVLRLAGDAELATLLGQVARDFRLHVHSPRPGVAGELAAQGRFEIWGGGDAEGFTGMPAALACCRFVEREKGGLLHLTQGADGSWYAIELVSV